MKILTKEEEQAHYRFVTKFWIINPHALCADSIKTLRETLKGGLAGGVGGLAIGALGIWGAAARYPAFRSLSLPLKAFMLTSSGTFGTILTADHFSRSFEKSQHPESFYEDEAQRQRRETLQQQRGFERFMTWGRENRYKVVGVSWVASMALAFTIVGRSSVLSPAQKLVQARVYAQSLTVALVLATAVFEIGDRTNEEGRYERILDPNDPEHKHMITKQIPPERTKGEDQWRDMVEAEERREKQMDDSVHEQEEIDWRSGKAPKKAHRKHKNGEKKDGKQNEGTKEQN
ncbi:MAG: hypothetical protein LQ351_004320 [Letrouitia transgressa]|nr:MAG: hypothetical protein LQ351_004320 [Letrouitia transgressa]